MLASWAGPDNELLTTAALAQVLGLSERWLVNARDRGYGPKFHLRGLRAQYRRGDVREWLKERADRGGYVLTDEARAKLSAASAAYWADPENRRVQSERRKITHNRVDIRLKHSAATKRMMSDPEMKAKISAALVGNKNAAKEQEAQIE